MKYLKNQLENPMIEAYVTGIIFAMTVVICSFLFAAFI